MASKSIENYKLAKSLYYDLSDSFFEIENKDLEEEDYIIDKTLEDAKKLKRVLDRIDIEELEAILDIDTMDVVEDNIKGYEEAVYFIENSLNAIKYYDTLVDPIKKYIVDVDWSYIANDEEEAAKKTSRYLADNYDTYKNQMNAIMRHSMPEKSFNNLFNSIKSKLKGKKTGKKQEYRHPVPPEMYDEKGRKEWEKEKERAKKDALKYTKPEGSEEFDVMGESFVTLKKYNQYLNGIQD